ncbi:helix-turn-helix domain-containing protein [Micrococcus luteus]|uniref:helix-turn-helix domain-containing protein n=1 Tax=Micrococcus luteus TaxID=1270 RepID=UPI0009E3742A|nr:helix-turn-helix domain-containing protein [Micrococcus sp. JV4]RYD01209.1 DNA-binding protein [Micrococcus sp. MS-ASIII-49]
MFLGARPVDSTTPVGLTIAEFANAIAASPATVRRMIARGDLHAYRYGPRIIRIPHAELERIARPVTSLAEMRGGGAQ